MNNEFPTSGRDEKVKVDIIFGIDGYDPMDESPLFDYKQNQAEMEAAAEAKADKPHVVWYDAFDWSKPATQKFLLATCNELDSTDFVAADRASDCWEEPCPQEKTLCVVSALGEWLVRDCAVEKAKKPDEQCYSAATCMADGVGSCLDAYKAAALQGVAESCVSADSGTTCTHDGGGKCTRTAGTGECAYVPAAAFDTTWAVGLPEAIANRVIYDFYKKGGWEQKARESIGFADKSQPSKVRYLSMTFSIPMKDGSFYRPSEYAEMYNKIDGFCKGLDAPSHVAGANGPMHTDHSQMFMWWNTQELCPGHLGRLSGLSVLLCKSVLYGGFVWARGALKHQKRRFPARADLKYAMWGIAVAVLCPRPPGAVKRP
jgi:hypothetical protein